MVPELDVEGGSCTNHQHERAPGGACEGWSVLLAPFEFEGTFPGTFVQMNVSTNLDECDTCVKFFLAMRN